MLFSFRNSLSILYKNLYNGQTHPNSLPYLIKVLIHALITLPILANKFPFYGLTNSLFRRHQNTETLELHRANETGCGKVLLTILLLASRHLCKHPSKPIVTFNDSQVHRIASFLLLSVLLGISCVQFPCLRNLLLSLSHLGVSFSQNFTFNQNYHVGLCQEQHCQVFRISSDETHQEQTFH